MNNRITIIIPTYHRTEYLKRALEYWSIYPVNLIIVDGSVEPSVKDELLNLYESVEYFNLRISVEKRLLFASKKIRTPYAAIISDDEFLVYSALVAAEKILDSEQQVSAVLGATLGFNVYKKEVIARWHYQTASQLDISAISPKARLEQRLNVESNSIFYPLVRSDVLKLACEFIGAHQYSSPYIAENQMEAIICAAGAVRVMPILMWFRSFQQSMVSNPTHNRSILFSDWIANPLNSKDVENLIISASKYLSLATSSLQPLSGKEFVDLFEQAELRNLESQKEFTEKKSILKKNYLKLPRTWRELAREIFYYLFQTTPEGMKPVTEVLNQLAKSNISFDRCEIKKIEELIKRDFASG